MFEVKLNKEENKIEVFNVSEFDFSNITLSDPIEIEPKKYDSILNDLGLNVLVPTEDGEDFIYTYVSTNFLSDKIYNSKTLIGRRYTELYSFAKSTVNWYKQVYETGEKTTVYIYFYENGSLVTCLEQKVILVNDELFVFMDEKSDLIQVKTQKSPFEASSLPKILIKKDGSVKINVAYESLINAKERNINKLTLDDLDEYEIVYNDVHLDLKVSDMFKKILNGEYYQIGYNMRLLNSEDKYSLVHGIARLVNYDNENSVEFIILKELLEDELGLTLASDVNIETMQELTKSTFLYYNINNNTFSWGKGLEDILEGPIPGGFNLIDVLDEVTITKDLNKRGATVDDININNPQIKTDYKIKTFKGNIKYIDATIKAIIEDGEITKLLYFFNDVTDEVLRNYDLLSLRDTLNDVQSAADMGISYRDAEGNRFWTPGFYEIIERAPREEDRCRNLFKDYLTAEDYERLTKEVKELGPNEYLGDQILPITLYGGKKKYIKFNLRKIYDDNGNFIRISEYTMDVTEEVLRNRELAELNATVEDVQSATSIGIHYVTPDGKYHWTPEYYKLIEREPRPEDEDHNIIYDLFLPEDQDKLSKLIDDLGPNEFLGGIVVPIILESGKKKYVRINSHKIYDKDGNFIRRTGYTRDVTDEILNSYELLSLRDTVEDVQEAASLGIHYVTPEGKYHWTSEYYNLIERGPRPDDINRHIVFDLLSKEDKEEIEKLIEELEPNELLGNIVKPITLENGKKKYITINTRKVYDEYGNFIRKIGYTQDITEEVSRNRELSELNNTVKEVQAATLMGIHYVTPTGRYHWTPEYYNILEREPRPDDKYHHILLDLLEDDDRIEINNAMDKLESNELLEDIVKEVTLENGKKKYIQFNGRKIYDKEGNFIRKIGYAKDVTKDVLKDQELFNLRETVEDVQAAISIGIHYLSPNGKYHWTPEYYNILEREPRPDDADKNIIFELLSDEDHEEIEELLNNLPDNEFLGNIVKPITLENGKVKHVNFNGRKIYDKNGKFIIESGCIQDVSEFVEFETALMKADYEKTVLIKEVHHRVKNNLQTISSFMSLEERYGTDLTSIVQKTQNRIRVLALIHEAIYAETDMKCVSIKQFIEKFDELLESISLDSDTSFINDIEDLNLNMDEVTPIVLIINELTTNSFKHAFNLWKHGEIYKSIHRFEKDGKKYYRFHYRDNGPGLSEDFDIESSEGLGWSIIKALSAQLDGEYKVFNKGGFNFVLEFPLIRQN